MLFSLSKALKVCFPAPDATIFQHALKTKGICSYGFKNIQFALCIAGINTFIFFFFVRHGSLWAYCHSWSNPNCFPLCFQRCFLFLKQFFLSNWMAAEVNQFPCV